MLGHLQNRENLLWVWGKEKDLIRASRVAMPLQRDRGMGERDKRTVDHRMTAAGAKKPTVT